MPLSPIYQSKFLRQNTNCLDIWDYGGHQSLYTGHQVFLSDQRVLTILVFDLRQELDSPALVPEYRTDPVTGALVVETRESELTHLDFILLWLELVSLAGRGRARAGLSRAEGAGPEIVIVGSHAESLHTARDMQLSMVRSAEQAVDTKYCEQAELKFERIRQSVEGKPFEKSILKTMFCVNSLEKDSTAVR